MLSSYFANSKALVLLVALLVLVVVALVAGRTRRQALRLWGAGSFAVARGGARLLSLGLLLFGLGSLVVGIAGPQWGPGDFPEVKEGRDIVCVLDVSRSMLAEDVLPNRLDRAEAALEELSRTIQERGGHRLGLGIC